MQTANPDLIALTIQQPWAELILRGIKTIEVRSVLAGTQQMIYLYASKRFSTLPVAAKTAKRHDVDLKSLPTGMVVGTVTIAECRKSLRTDAAAACIPWPLLKEKYSWMLKSPNAFASPVAARKVPFGMWFYPFQASARRQP